MVQFALTSSRISEGIPVIQLQRFKNPRKVKQLNLSQYEKLPVKKETVKNKFNLSLLLPSSLPSLHVSLHSLSENIIKFLKILKGLQVRGQQYCFHSKKGSTFFINHNNGGLQATGILDWLAFCISFIDSVHCWRCCLGHWVCLSLTLFPLFQLMFMLSTFLFHIIQFLEFSAPCF